MSAADQDSRIQSVSEVTQAARLLIEERFPLVWVSGELSNFRRPGSGHWYFTLKDDRSQLRCAMFAGRNRRVSYRPADGDQVIVRGHLSLYTGRGDFQAIVEHMEPAGAGALRAAFDALRAKLAAEGLFAEDRKRDLLMYPEHLCVVSSASGAALQDVLAVLARRYPIARVTVLSTLVQGSAAAPAVERALQRAAELDADLIIVTRGGGSLEDLWTFNTESVVRAVAASPIPVISAIGHETDVTLTDFAADLRAPTPSAAAELATPDAAELLRQLAGVNQSLHTSMQRSLQQAQRRLSDTRRRLPSPRRIVEQFMQRTDQLDERLLAATRRRLSNAEQRLHALTHRARQASPARRLQEQRQRLTGLRARLERASGQQRQQWQQRLTGLLRALDAVSPLRTLSRGYAIVGEGPASAASPWGAPLHSSHAITPGSELLAHLADGTLVCRVDARRALPAELSTESEQVSSNDPNPTT